MEAEERRQQAEAEEQRGRAAEEAKRKAKLAAKADKCRVSVPHVDLRPRELG